MGSGQVSSVAVPASSCKQEEDKDTFHVGIPLVNKFSHSQTSENSMKLLPNHTMSQNL